MPPVVVSPPPPPQPPPSITQPALPGLLIPLPSTGGTELPRFPTPPPVVELESIERFEPAWELALTLDRTVRLEQFQRGVLCNVGDVPHELGPDGALVAKPAADHLKVQVLVDRDSVLGAWPDDAWRVGEDYDRGGSDLSFHKWNGSKRWVAQPLIRGRKIGEDDLATYRWTPRGGLLLVPRRDQDGSPSEPVKFHRVAGNSPDPTPMALADGVTVEDAVETEDATLYVFASRDNSAIGMEILRHCDQAAAPGCERIGGVALGRPKDGTTTYYTGVITPRDGASMSAAITELTHDGSFFPFRTPDRLYLVHYERGGWTLDAVPRGTDVHHMLPAPDGSLWIILQQAATQTLWHRSPTGHWVAVPLPERADPKASIQIALRDESHLWMAVNSGDHHAIYSIRAALQPAPASPI